MRRQPAFANYVSPKAKVVHLYADLELVRAEFDDHNRQLESFRLGLLPEPPVWSLIAATDGDHNWQCCAGKTVAVHFPLEPAAAQVFFRDGAVAAFFLDPEGRLTQCIGE